MVRESPVAEFYNYAKDEGSMGYSRGGAGHLAEEPGALGCGGLLSRRGRGGMLLRSVCCRRAGLLLVCRGRSLARGDGRTSGGSAGRSLARHDYGRSLCAPQ